MCRSQCVSERDRRAARINVWPCGRLSWLCWRPGAVAESYLCDGHWPQLRGKAAVHALFLGVDRGILCARRLEPGARTNHLVIGDISSFRWIVRLLEENCQLQSFFSIHGGCSNHLLHREAAMMQCMMMFASSLDTGGSLTCTGSNGPSTSMTFCCGDLEEMVGVKTDSFASDIGDGPLSMRRRVKVRAWRKVMTSNVVLRFSRTRSVTRFTKETFVTRCGWGLPRGPILPSTRCHGAARGEIKASPSDVTGYDMVSNQGIIPRRVVESNALFSLSSS